MTKMKLISIMMVIAMLALAGCSSNEEPAVTELDVPSTDSEAIIDDTGVTTEEGMTEVPVTIQLDYTTGLDDNGFHENVVATDHVELMDYETVGIPAEIHTIPEDTIQSEIDGLMTYFTTSAQVLDRAVVDGDTVNIDYVGSVDGVDFEGGSTGGAGADVTIGVTSYIDDFLEQLIGHTPGESFDIVVTFPEDYGVENLNGKDAVFAITLNYISEDIVPELTDEFVAENLSEINSWTTIEDMNTGIKDELQTLAIKEYIQTTLLGDVIVTSLPESVLTYQKNIMLNFYKSAADQYGVSLEEFLQGNTEFESVDALNEGNADQLKEVAGYSLVIQAIAENSAITITEEDLSDYFLKYNGTADYSEYENTYGINYLKYTILQDLVLDYIVERAELL